MDFADITQIRSEQEEREMLSSRLQPKGDSALFCSDCGGVIPVKRRELVPGVKTCILCQKERERSSMEYF
jgi:phage/conjugal plasmid C-4 type zinc finger protein, TraR family